MPSRSPRPTVNRLAEAQTVTNRIDCPMPVVERTLQVLRDGGSVSQERVVFWLARVSDKGETFPIVQAYVPEQETAADYFRIPPHAMRALMLHLRRERLRLCTQVHSHPDRAFHSRADNECAVIRHQGALSLVVPHFGMRTTAATFFKDMVAFQLDSHDRWIELSPVELSLHLTASC